MFLACWVVEVELTHFNIQKNEGRLQLELETELTHSFWSSLYLEDIQLICTPPNIVFSNLCGYFLDYCALEVVFPSP